MFTNADVVNAQTWEVSRPPKTFQASHLKKSCVQNDTSESHRPQSIRITLDIKRQLKQIHLNKLKQEFGVNI